MSFKKPLPTWKAQGIQPPEHKLEEGWKAQDKPPAGWLNWQANTTFEALKELQDNAIDHRDVTSKPSASGVVRLNEAGKLNEAVLAGAEHKEITLKPGVQIVESDHDTPFNVGSIKGRTLVNLLGCLGNCESLYSKYYAGRSTMVLDDTNQKSGACALKVTANTEDASHYFRFVSNSNNGEDLISITPHKYYIFGVWAKVEKGQGQVDVIQFDELGNSIVTQNGGVTTQIGEYILLYRRFQAQPNAISMMPQVLIKDTNGNVSFTGNGESIYIDDGFVYEITQAEYSALEKIELEEVVKKYSYVDCISNVVNPYVTVTSGNLIPPFTSGQWLKDSWLNIHGEYRAICHNVEGAVRVIGTCTIEAKPLTIYTYGGTITDGGAYLDVIGFDSKGGVTMDAPNVGGASQNGNPLSFKTTADTTSIQFRVVTTTSGWYEWRNLWAVEGTEPIQFKPQRRSLWAVETQLAAHPVDGTNPDVLHMGDDGSPYVIEKWGKVTLDGTLKWGVSTNVFENHKIVRVPDLLPEVTLSHGDSYLKDRSVLTDYSGQLIRYLTGVGTSWTTTGYQVWNGILYLAVCNKDSGWGDTYTPTSDEIKAFFNGWRMYTLGNRESFYNGTGTKCWYPITQAKINEPFDPAMEIRDMAPNYMAQNKAIWQPYRLQYLKAIPTVEPVRNCETGLTLFTGSNHIKVGSGIVIREKFNLSDQLNNSYGQVYLADTMQASSLLNCKPASIHSIYASSINVTNKWIIYSGNNQQGTIKARAEKFNYDPTAVYHVTYTRLDPTLPATINCTLAANLRGMVSDLLQRSGDVEQRLSAVEMKKVNKNVKPPQWIRATLLNGWKDTTGIDRPISYRRLGDVLEIDGVATGGTTELGTVLFVLPAQVRPSANQNLVVLTSTGSSYPTIRVFISAATGEVRIALPGGGNVWLALNGTTVYL